MRYPSVPISLAMLAGASLGFLVETTEPHAVAGAVWLACGLAAAAVRYGTILAAAVVVCGAYAVCGAALSATAQTRALRPELRDTLTALLGPAGVGAEPAPVVVVTGVLAADAAPLDTGVRLALDVTAVAAVGAERPTTGRVLLTVAGGEGLAAVALWRAGRTVRTPATLRRPARYANPGVPDFERATLRRGVAMVGTVKSPQLVEVTARGSWLSEAGAAVRAWIRRTLERNVGHRSVRSAAIVRAILIGDRTSLDDETQERMQAAGSYHVLAISGGNIAILAGVLLGVLALAGCRAPWRELAAIVMLCAYAWLVGGGASVVRATTMAVTMLAAMALAHRSGVVNAMAVALGLGVAANPLTLFDPGTWLSYGATGAIVLAGGLTAPVLARWPTVPRALAGICVASVAAELALFPVGAFVFSRATAAGVVVNLAAVPLMAGVQIGGLALLAASALGPPVEAAVGHGVHLAAWALVECGRVVDAAPWLARRLPAPPVAIMAAYYASWATWLVAIRLPCSHPGRPVLTCAALPILLTSAAWMLAAPVLPGTWPARAARITVLDVGQGHTALVQAPNGQSLLVDAGGAGGSKFDIGGRVIAPSLWALGVRRLTYLVVTHGDADHANGAVRAIRDFRPMEVWEGVPVPAHALMEEIRAAAVAAGASWRRTQRGDRVELGDLVVDVQHPVAPDWERRRVRNDDSVVMDVRVGATAVLLTGDVEAGAEALLTSVLPGGVRRVLLAPHHGSATSLGADLLRAVRPAAVLVSAGRGNPYGHPHLAAVARVERAGVPLFRTDRDGAVSVYLDGRTIRVSTFSRETRRP